MKNNFDLLRLLLSIGVLLSHLATLTEREEFRSWFGRIDAQLCVYAFFAISGFLITGSWERSRGLIDYSAKRCRRILPGYIAVILFGVLVGGVFNRLNWVEYITHPQTGAYVVWNLLFLNMLQPGPPGVLENIPFSGVMNGALWSIRVELFCYALLPVWLIFARRLSMGLSWLLVMATVIAGGEFILSRELSSSSALWTQIRIGILLPVAYFTAGSMWYRWSTLYRWNASLCLLGAIGGYLLAGLLPSGHFRLCAQVLPLTVFVLTLGTGRPYLGNWGRWGDLSYGIYIYHFPAIQLLVQAEIYTRAPLSGLILTLLLVLGLSLCSWHLVEKRWLLRSSHYVRATEQTAAADPTAPTVLPQTSAGPEVPPG